MAGYDFLNGVTVIEAAWLGPGSLGGLLADMGATVIKVESPGDGDRVRYTGSYAVGDPEGMGFMHLRWNRGKKSVAIDLKSPDGKKLFERLAAGADVVIEGMRGGALDRLGLGNDVLSRANPRLVFCSVSGLGRFGPYAHRGSNAPSYDLFAGLASPESLDNVSKFDGPQPTPIGMMSMGMHAAMGVLAAIVKAQRTGVGSQVEVAACDSAAHWLTEALEPILNRDVAFERTGWVDDGGRMYKWSRLDNYVTADKRVIYLQLYYERFWLAFMKAVGRPDLADFYQRYSHDEVDAKMAAEIAGIIRQRPYAEWAALFEEHGVAFMPVNTFEDLTRDPHFLARDNIYTVRDPNGRELKLTSTPVKVEGQSFSPTLAPVLGEHTDEVLTRYCGLTPADIEALRAKKAVG